MVRMKLHLVLLHVVLLAGSRAARRLSSSSRRQQEAVMAEAALLQRRRQARRSLGQQQQQGQARRRLQALLSPVLQLHRGRAAAVWTMVRQLRNNLWEHHRSAHNDSSRRQHSSSRSSSRSSQEAAAAAAASWRATRPAGLALTWQRSWPLSGTGGPLAHLLPVHTVPHMPAGCPTHGMPAGCPTHRTDARRCQLCHFPGWMAGCLVTAWPHNRKGRQLHNAHAAPNLTSCSLPQLLRHGLPASPSPSFATAAHSPAALHEPCTTPGCSAVPQAPPICRCLPACRYTLLQQEFLQARGALLDLEVAAGSAQAGWKAADRRAADAEALQAAMSVELAEARAAKVKLEMDLVGE